MLRKITRVILTLTIVSVLILNFNLIDNSKAEVIENGDDGVWADDFLSEDGLSDKNNVTIENGSISSKSIGKEAISYIFDKTSEHEAYNNKHMTMTQTSDGVFEPSFLLSSKKIIGETKISESERELLETDEGEPSGMLKSEPWSRRHKAITTASQRFTFKLDNNAEYVNDLYFTWMGNYEKSSGIQVYAWEYYENDLLPKAGKWKLQENYLNNQEYEVEIDIPNATSFIGPDDTVDILIIGIPTDSKPEEIGFDDIILYTDYVSISSGVSDKYSEKANVVSNKISPKGISSISGDKWHWEKIFWNSQNVGDKATVKIQVLDKNLKTISNDDLFGNKEGFVSSPLDISSLSVSDYDQIYLKAIFECKDRTKTAVLYDWAVTWQTDRLSFSDSFSTSLRIDKNYGGSHSIDDGEFTVSDVSGSWPMFGKHSDNNRVYFGDDPNEFKKYWSIETTPDVNSLKMFANNLFCSPVISDDTVFMPFATDKRIYSYNLSKDGTKEQKILSFTEELEEKFGMSPLVTDKYVIIGTSSLETKNMIHAFNKTDLKKEEWNYTDNTVNSISFSASPVVDDGKIFISSWDGRGTTCPPLDLAKDYVNSYEFLKDIFQVKTSGKITVLDEEDGSLLWSKDLPAASFSTPAVYKNKVYVACENMEGGSLFAFDKNTGEELWNVSVGIIGRSSPVVYYGNVYVLAKSGPLVEWTDKLVAVDADSGELDWEIEIGSSFGVQSIPKNFLSFIKQFGFDEDDTVDLFTMRDLISASTPVLDNGTAYVISTDGVLNAIDLTSHKKVWNMSLLDHDSNIVKFYFAGSPAIADDMIYSLTYDGYLYRVSTNGSLDWAKKLSDYADWSFGSPVIANGLVLANYLDRMDLDWGLMSIGDLVESSQSKIISSKIAPLNGNWWKSFDADYELNDGSISFSIINNDGKEVVSGLDGKNNDISTVGIDSRYIHLVANIMKTGSDSPVLKDWSISWGAEEAEPEFKTQTVTVSGESSDNGFYGGGSETISIDVFDNAHKRDSVEILSGIDGDSVRYRVNYSGKDGKNYVTDWLKGESSEGSGVKNSTLVAYVSDIIKASKKATIINKISFKFSDLAGNEVSQEGMLVKIDVGKPESDIVSEIKDNDCITDLTLEVEASDDESGLKEIVLKYRHKTTGDWSEWKNLKTLDAEEPLVYVFKDKSGSGFYQVKSVAVDNVGNVEEKDKAELEFKFDDNKPSISANDEKISLKDLPVELRFKDDLEIDRIYYSVDDKENWVRIREIDIYNGTTEITWNLTKDFLDVLMDEEEFLSMDIKVRDSCGNEYILENLSIDISGEPSGPGEDEITVLLLDDFSDIQWDDEFRLAADIPDDIDAEKVTLYYKYSSDKKDWSEWKKVGASKTSDFIWDFKASKGNGYYQFYTEIETESGVIESKAQKATVSVFPTIPVVLLVIVIIALLITSVFVFLKMRKKKLEAQ